MASYLAEGVMVIELKDGSDMLAGGDLLFISTLEITSKVPLAIYNVLYGLLGTGYRATEIQC